MVRCPIIAKETAIFAGETATIAEETATIAEETGTNAEETSSVRMNFRCALSDRKCNGRLDRRTYNE